MNARLDQELERLSAAAITFSQLKDWLLNHAR
jgi:hypothetical protein